MHLIHSYIVTYGAIALFVIIYFESLGAPLPGESALIAGSILALHGDLNLYHMLIAVFCGAVLGDSTGYLIGHFGGVKLIARYGYLVRLTPERLQEFENIFKKKGPYIVATARFVPILRQLNGIVAGSLKMPWPHFFIANAAGAAAWTLLWGAGPYFFSGFFHPIYEKMRE
ncbi:DedA family protein [Phyllobacterium leguminum]|uniref:Membrane protein DedA with SNARE-associated domain n=1 Tax=Phyllobacterium leguminum TaxID=314237 RepID=A0A318T676_9HYPH|nr:DedA family protein [Phyllobacterium leguminum]PYE90589.1 membrane protein DedA with SNARE-associated domain [Phyllobacterium leguminum]